MSKLTVFIVLLCFIAPATADEYKPPEPIQSDKLGIIAKAVTEDDDGSNPKGWMRFYEFTIKRGVENIVYLTAKFDINNVQSIIISDENAVNNKCGRKQKRRLLHLHFSDPGKNQKEIMTRLEKPCFVGREAIYKLSVKTADNKHYYNYTKLIASKYAFDYVYHAEY